MIRVVKEPDNFASIFWGATECCFFCGKETKYWHKKTNTPVCKECAKKYSVSDLDCLSE